MRRRWAFGHAFGQALAIALALDKLEPASNGSVLRSAPRRSNKILFAVSAIQASLAVKVGGWGPSHLPSFPLSGRTSPEWRPDWICVVASWLHPNALV